MMSLHIDSTPLPYILLLKNLCNVPLINSVIHIFPKRHQKISENDFGSDHFRKLGNVFQKY